VKARENADRWVEALQILADGSDNLGESGRAGLAESRRTMLDAAYAEVRAEVLAETAALADPAKPEVSFFGDYGPQVAWWLRMLIGRKEGTPGVAAPDFFIPGRTYQREHHGEPIVFQVAAVSASPDGRCTVAHGWRTDLYTDWSPFDSDDLTGWTDVTGAGDGS
jgi:hypothetical protein